MPVQRFRSFREARIAQWLSPDDPRLLRRIRGWWASSARFWPTRPPRGVHKFRSIEEMNAAQAAWKSERLPRPSAASDPASED